MDLDIESENDSYDEDEETVYFSYSPNETQQIHWDNPEKESMNKSTSCTKTNSQDLDVVVTDEAVVGNNLRVEHKTAISEDDFEEDWDAECDDNASEFVLAKEALYDPYSGSGMLDDEDHTDLQFTDALDEISPTENVKSEINHKTMIAAAATTAASPWKASPSTHHQQMTNRQWLSEIEDLYFEEREDSMKELLQAAFNSHRDPYDFTLYVAANASFDLYSRRPSITKITLETFNIWLRSKFFSRGKSGTDTSPKLQPFHKELAMDYVVSTGLNYIDLLISAYELLDGDKKSQAKKLGHLFDKGDKHKEVAIIAGKLMLQYYFHPDELMLPLLAFDKVQVIETFVGEDKKQQDLFLRVLDNLCSKSDEELLDFVRNKGLKIVDKNKFKTKTMQKISEKYVKKYCLDPVDYPNVFRTKNTESLHLLLRKKYQERKMLGKESKKWDGLLEGAVVGSTALQQQLVQLLELEHGDLEAALSWARWCGVSLDALPPKCREVMEQERRRPSRIPEKATAGDRAGHSESSEALPTQCVTHTNSSDEFYELSIPRQNVTIVDTGDQLYKCLNKLFKSGHNIGFDAEWVPIYGRAGTQERIAILQLATVREVFIIDLISLNETEKGKCAIRELLEELLTSKENLVIGYGVTSDIRILIANYPYSKAFVLKSQRFIDMCDLSQTVFSHPSVKKRFPETSDSSEKGLSLLVKRCLGKYLDKTFQVSNWEKRPLFEEQIIYAALDAYCLLEVYALIKMTVNELQLKISLEPELYVPGVHEPKERLKKPEKVQEQPVVKCVVSGPPKGPSSLKVVCDTMLQGLGRSLRCCGIDTVVLSNDEDHTKAIELSHKENRVILTKGRPFYRMRGYVKPVMIMDVPNAPTKDQIAAILKRYNVKITKRDIFSRCQNCNGNYYVKVNNDTMRKAYGIKTGSLFPEIEVSDGPVDYKDLTINNGVRLKIEYIQKPQLDNVDMFFCCGTCGKIYWDGSHFGKKLDQFKDLITINTPSSNRSIYDTL